MAVLTVMGLVLLAQMPGSGQTQQPVIDRLAITQRVFANLLIYRTVAAAEAGGFRSLEAPGQPLCVPQMGTHYSRGWTTIGGQNYPVLPILLFNKGGYLIGFELESAVAQPTPPWEHLPQGHPGMPFEHWTFHVYITDPTTACQ